VKSFSGSDDAIKTIAYDTGKKKVCLLNYTYRTSKNKSMKELIVAKIRSRETFFVNTGFISTINGTRNT
jgi:hypothetical protein